MGCCWVVLLAFDWAISKEFAIELATALEFSIAIDA